MKNDIDVEECTTREKVSRYNRRGRIENEVSKVQHLEELTPDWYPVDEEGNTRA